MRTSRRAATAWLAPAVLSLAIAVARRPSLDAPIAVFWGCLCGLVVLAAIPLPIGPALTVATGFMAAVVALVRDHVPSHDALLGTIGIAPTGLLSMVLASYATRYRDAHAEVGRLTVQAEAAVDRERRLFRNAAHELRSPLTIALGHLDLVAAALDSPTALADGRSRVGLERGRS